MQTFTYKTVDGLEIQADIYRPKDDHPHPAVIWIHGGGLILGNRSWMNLRARKLLLDAGYIVVSIDFRIAPETKLPEIVTDVEDAVRWVHEHGPELFNADTQRLAVIGTSAGGYLAMIMGYRAQPCPAAIVSFWGYGDPLDDWFSRPSEYYRKQKLVNKKTAMKAIGKKPVADGHINEEHRRDLYRYIRQMGLWTEMVGGIDPKTERKKLDPYVPINNVTQNFPPTLLIHGTADEDVPHSESQKMADEFTRRNVEHHFISVPDAGHTLAGGDPKLVGEVYAELVPFLNRHILDQ